MALIKIFDISVLRSSYEGLPESLQKNAVNIYLEEAAEFVAAILAADGPNEPEVVHAFHSLRTMSRMIGACEMASLCDIYEQSGSTEEKERVISSMQGAWSSLEQELHFLLNNDTI